MIEYIFETLADAVKIRSDFASERDEAKLAEILAEKLNNL